MRRVVATVILIASALVAAPARGDVDDAARKLASDPVYVDPRAADRLTVAEQGRIRLAIVRLALGRVKVAVMPGAEARRAGGIAELAGELDRRFELRGTLIVVAGSDYWAVTSYPNSDAAAGELRAAVNERPNDRLAGELIEAIRRIARVDPGAALDARNRPGVTPAFEVPGGDDFLDDIGDAFRLGVLIVAAAVALPFVLVAVFLVLRARRGRAREEEVAQAGERTARAELVALGDEIRALDIDTSMPDANRAALAEYEQGLASYDQANDLLSGDPTPYRVEQARAAIAAGRRHVEAARARLG